jgi:hypothetical protein
MQSGNGYANFIASTSYSESANPPVRRKRNDAQRVRFQTGIRPAPALTGARQRRENLGKADTRLAAAVSRRVRPARASRTP